MRNQKTYQGRDPQAACQLADAGPRSTWKDSACMQMQTRAATAGFPPTGGCCYSRGLMNETRIASTTVERRTGAGDSCAGDRFTSRSYQSEGVKGPNPGKPGAHPLDTNPNRVSVTDANAGLRSMVTAPAFAGGMISAKVGPCPPLGTGHPATEGIFICQRSLLTFLGGVSACLRPFSRCCWSVDGKTVSHQPPSSGYPQGRSQTIKDSGAHV